MLFQMVFEKLAKAVLARTDRGAFIACLGKHTSASRLVIMLKNHAAFTDIKHQNKTLLPILTALERLHPALSASGHLEYPWEEGDRVLAPSELRIVQELADPRVSWGSRAQRLARELLNKFDTIFG